MCYRDLFFTKKLKLTPRIGFEHRRFVIEDEPSTKKKIIEKTER